LMKAADLLTPIVNANEIEVIFYHLDSTNLATFPTQQLKKIINAFE